MTIGRITIFIGILLVVGYVGVHMIMLRIPPALELITPPQGLMTSNHTIQIQGKTNPGATLKINGIELPPPQSGEFKHVLVLPKGVSTIQVAARKRHSKSAVIERQVFILEGERISQIERGGI